MIRRTFLLFLAIRTSMVADAQWESGFREREAALRADTGRYAAIELSLLEAAQWTVSTKGMEPLLRAEALLHALPVRADSSKSVEELKLWAHYHYLMGYQQKFRRDFPVALRHFQRTLDLRRSQRDTIGSISAHDALGVLYQAVGERRLAEQEFRQAWALIQGHHAWRHGDGMLGHNRIEHTFYSGAHLVGVLVAQGNMEEARDFLEHLETIPKRQHGHQALLDVQRANWLRCTGDHLEAMQVLSLSDAGFVRQKARHWDRLSVITPLARVLVDLGRFEEAVQVADTCVALANWIGDEAAECGCAVLAAQGHLGQGNSNRAERDLLRALKIAEANGYMGLARELGNEGSMVGITALLKDLYLKQVRTYDALAMTTLYAAYKDTLYGMEGREDVMRAGLHQHMLADSLRKAEELRMAHFTFQTALHQEKRRGRVVLVVGGMLTLLLSWLGYSIHRRRAQEKRISALELQRLEQAKLIDELRIREEVGRDMHDDLGAGLSAIRLRSELAQRHEADPARQEQFAAMARHAEELITNMRQLIWSMTTEEGDLQGTVDHCLRYARTYLAEHGLRAELLRPDALPELELSPEQRRNIFLLVKEALHNTVKHAEAEHVRVEFAWGRDLRIAIHDDGKGLPDGAEGTGRGLTNMRSRADALGGSIAFGHDRGTLINVRVPLRDPSMGH